ncbi:MAG: ATP-grasp domain-containing protein [Acetobacteraceae bacterium]
MRKIFVVHENNDWMVPLRRELAELAAPFEEWFLDRGVLDLTEAPPEGVFYNRMSASSHTRGHEYAPEYAAAVIEWLERHGRTVVNGRRALQLEVSKIAQYEALAEHGIPTPATVAVIGREHIPEAARRVGYPLILKHNRAGKGLGVRLVASEEALPEALAAPEGVAPRDGIWLVQRYVRAPGSFITRAEFVGGRFLYAVRVDTSEGFELCPSDQCQVAENLSPKARAPGEKFKVVEGFRSPLVPRLERFLAENDIGIGAVEFVTDETGAPFVYDVNTNTNYNAEAERRVGVSGMAAIARHLTRLLHEEAPAIAAE